MSIFPEMLIWVRGTIDHYSIQATKIAVYDDTQKFMTRNISESRASQGHPTTLNVCMF